jgi:hypothetical protein
LLNLVELRIPLPAGTSGEVFVTSTRRGTSCLPADTAPGFLLDELRAE